RRSWTPFGVELMTNPSRAPACRSQVKDSPHDPGFRFIDLTLDVQTLRLASRRVRQGHGDVVVPEDGASRHLASSRLPNERIVRALSGLVTLHLVGEGHD